MALMETSTTGGKKALHYPRLDTVLRVEKILKESDEPIAKNEIDRRLEKKIMRQTLNLILEYLEESNKVITLPEGVLWIYEDNISKGLKNKMNKARRVM